MSVYKDQARGTWTVAVNLPVQPDGRRPQVKRRGFPTKRAARDHEVQLLHQARGGRVAASSRMTFGGYLTDRWLPYIEDAAGLKAKSIEGYQTQVKRLVAGLGHIRLDQLSGDHLSRLYVDMRQKGYSARTIQYTHATARKALADARRWRLTTSNAAEDADTPAGPRPNPQAWSAEQMRQYLDVAARNRWYALWLLAYVSGMRRGELAALRWEDFDLDAAAVTVSRNRVVVGGHGVVEGTTKSSRARRVALDAPAVAALRDWSGRQADEQQAFGAGWQGDGDLWTWADGSSLHPNIISRTHMRLVKEAGLPPLSLHKLRHASATHALDAGVHVSKVSKRLGHASVSITMDMYVAPTDEGDAQAAAMLANVYAGHTPRSVEAVPLRGGQRRKARSRPDSRRSTSR